MSMNRRSAVLALLACPLGYYRAFAQGSTLPVGKATLTVNLNQWKGIHVTFGDKATFVTSADIFNALAGEER